MFHHPINQKPINQNTVKILEKLEQKYTLKVRFTTGGRLKV